MNVVVRMDKRECLKNLLADVCNHRLAQLLLLSDEVCEAPAVHILHEHLY